MELTEIEERVLIEKIRLQDENSQLRKIIILQDKILHGNKNKIGIFACYDTYYKGCWDKLLKKIKKIKLEILKKNNQQEEENFKNLLKK